MKSRRLLYFPDNQIAVSLSQVENLISSTNNLPLFSTGYSNLYQSGNNYAYTLDPSDDDDKSGFDFTTVGNSVVFGSQCKSRGEASFTCGTNNRAGSHAIATGHTTKAIGEDSLTSGIWTIASGQASLASGWGSQASHLASQAFGYGTQTGRKSQLVCGEYNEVNGDALFIVGAGIETDKIDENGKPIIEQFNSLSVNRNKIVLKTYDDNGDMTPISCLTLGDGYLTFSDNEQQNGNEYLKISNDFGTVKFFTPNGTIFDSMGEITFTGSGAFKSTLPVTFVSTLTGTSANFSSSIVTKKLEITDDENNVVASVIDGILEGGDANFDNLSVSTLTVTGSTNLEIALDQVYNYTFSWNYTEGDTNRYSFSFIGLSISQLSTPSGSYYGTGWYLADGGNLTSIYKIGVISYDSSTRKGICNIWFSGNSSSTPSQSGLDFYFY